MKKTLNALARRAAATLLSLLLLCTVCFTSCSDDDDDDEGDGDQTGGTTLSAPTDLAATAAGEDDDGDVVLSWSAVDGAKYYWVYRNTTGDSASATLLVDAVTTTTYTMTVPYDGNYYYWLKAADGFSDDETVTTSDFSNMASIYVGGFSNLEAPTGVSAAVSTDTSNAVDITWSRESSSFYCSIYYSTTNDSSTATLLEKNVYSGVYSTYYPTATETIVLTESGMYYFWLKRQSVYWSSSADGVDTSDFSDPASIEFTYTELEAPDDLAVTRAYTNALKISWEDTGAAYYWVYYNTEDDSTTAKQLDKTTSASTILALDEDDDGTTYYFWVKAADGYSSDCASSDYSSSVSYAFTYTTLTAPSNVTVATTSLTNTVKVTWDDTGAYYYRVYQNTTDSTDDENLTLVTKYISGYCYYYVTLSSSGTYYFWVQSADGASDSDAVSDYSSSASIEFTVSN